MDTGHSSHLCTLPLPIAMLMHVEITQGRHRNSYQWPVIELRLKTQHIFLRMWGQPADNMRSTSLATMLATSLPEQISGNVEATLPKSVPCPRCRALIDLPPDSQAEPLTGRKQR